MGVLQDVGAVLGDGCSPIAGCQAPRMDIPGNCGGGRDRASPGEVDALLSELAVAVDGVLVGLVLHHLDTLALLTLLVAVLADGVELPHAVLQPQHPAQCHPCLAPSGDTTEQGN